MWANGSSCSSSSFAAEQRCEAAEIKILSTIAHCLRCKWNVKTGALNQTGLCGSLSWRSVPKPRAFCFWFAAWPNLDCRKVQKNPCHLCNAEILVGIPIPGLFKVPSSTPPAKPGFTCFWGAGKMRQTRLLPGGSGHAQLSVVWMESPFPSFWMHAKRCCPLWVCWFDCRLKIYRRCAEMEIFGFPEGFDYSLMCTVKAGRWMKKRTSD